jgi:hypothetical protein
VAFPYMRIVCDRGSLKWEIEGDEGRGHSTKGRCNGR